MTKQSCPNCDGAVVESDASYCAQCGAKLQIERLSFRRIFSEAWSHLVELDTPLLRTFVELFYRPGRVAARYVDGERKRYASPLRYSLLAGAVMIASFQIFDLGDVPLEVNVTFSDPSDAEQNEEMEANIREWYTSYGYLLHFALLPILAAILRLVYLRRGRSWIEFYAVVLYAYGQTYLLMLAFRVLSRITWSWVDVLASAAPFFFVPAAVLGFVRGYTFGLGRIGAAVSTFLFAFIAHLLYFAVLAFILFVGGFVIQDSAEGWGWIG